MLTHYAARPRLQARLLRRRVRRSNGQCRAAGSAPRFRDRLRCRQRRV